MKRTCFFLGTLLLLSCGQDQNTTEQSATVNGDIIKEFYLNDSFEQDFGVFYHNELPFTGTLLDTFPNGQLQLRTPYLNGQEHGFAERWYENGQIMSEKFYTDGKRDGLRKSWWSNGQLLSEGNFVNDLKEGEHLAWYSNGQMSEKKNFKEGREEGNQKAWNNEGKLTSNYTFKKGKRYGIVGRQDCVSVVEAE